MKGLGFVGAGNMGEAMIRGILGARLLPPRGVVVLDVRPERTSEECMALMTRQRCRHLPVMKGGDLVGLVSIGDLVRCASAEQKAEIHFLTEYILGSYPGTETSALAVFARDRSGEVAAAV